MLSQKRFYCCGLVEMTKKPVMTFPMEKRNTTELFIDEGAEPQIQKL